MTNEEKAEIALGLKFQCNVCKKVLTKLDFCYKFSHYGELCNVCALTLADKMLNDN